jgi:hypothetical protein
MTSTLPDRIAGAAPFSPNSTASTCSAFTTSTITTSQAAPSSAGVAQPMAPLSTKDCTTSGRTSQTRTGKFARSSDFATPPPIDPRPTTPTLGLLMNPALCSFAQLPYIHPLSRKSSARDCPVPPQMRCARLSFYDGVRQ